MKLKCHMCRQEKEWVEFNQTKSGFIALEKLCNKCRQIRKEHKVFFKRFRKAYNASRGADAEQNL